MSNRRAQRCRDKIIEIISNPQFLQMLNGKRISRAAVDRLYEKHSNLIEENQRELIDLGLMFLAGSAKASASVAASNDNDMKLPLFRKIYLDDNENAKEVLTEDITPSIFFKSEEIITKRSKIKNSNSNMSENLFALLQEMRNQGFDDMTVKEYRNRRA